MGSPGHASNCADHAAPSLGNHNAEPKLRRDIYDATKNNGGADALRSSLAHRRPDPPDHHSVVGNRSCVMPPILFGDLRWKEVRHEHTHRRG
jgi:hypothetical protein